MASRILWAVTLLMATLKKPKLLLLDEHTAALDPKTAAKVLEISNKIVQENHLTTLMITHNMRDAIRFFLFSFGVYGTENRRSDTLPSVNSVIIYSCIIS